MEKKRMLAGVLAAVFILVSFCGCGQSTGGSSPQASGGASGKVYIRQYASSPGGQWYPMGTAINTVWDKYVPNISTSLSPGAGGENVKTVSNGDAEVAFSQAISVALARDGKEPFDRVYDNVKQLYAMHPAGIHLVVAANSDIYSLADLNGKRIGYGNVGEIQNAAIEMLLSEEYGITHETIIAAGGSINYFGDAEAPGALADGQVDIIMCIGSWPRAALAELEQNPGMRLISIEQDKLDSFIKNHPDWNTTVIPGGTYKGTDQDTTIICSYAVHIVNADMDEEMAYNLTKSVWEHIDDIHAASADAARWMSLEDALLAKDVVPLHPGAERYYKEIGML